MLLPKKQVPDGAKIGDKVKVFIYKDSSDRLIATTGTPKLEVGQCEILGSKRCGKDRVLSWIWVWKGSAPSLKNRHIQ